MTTTGHRTILTAALTVAAAAGVATAHGLYQVAAASRVPTAAAWLYPVITDGLALVAYAATARLHSGGRRYAATIVVLAAGLSGLAQAVYLAGGLDHASTAPVGLRFGVGAWPAIAAALTAHLLHLISTDPTTETAQRTPTDERPAVNERSAFNPPYNPALYNPASNPAVQPRTTAPHTTPPVQPAEQPPLYSSATDVNDSDRHADTGSPRDRARAAARRHRDTQGELPTVTELVDLAKVARGTAAKALRELRAERRALHVVATNPDHRTSQ
jgi:hypothetical protein